MTPLEARIRARIAASGSLSVADYMALALADPQHGYYVGGDPIGRAGDFVTAPEVSQVFGELVGLWCAEVWRAMGAPGDVMLVELGPGRGTLIADALRAVVAVAPAFARALRLELVEIGVVLRDRQRRALDALPQPPPAAWRESFAAVPAGPMLLVANEFFDALPIRQWQRRDGAWCERLVDAPDGADGFAFVLAPPAEPGPPFGVEEVVEGDLVEVCPAAEALAAAIAGRLARDGGAALIIDYGSARSGSGDTLQAVRGQRFADPLLAPGEADLSHHVDFARLAEAARAAGGAVFGPVPQGLFLGRLGLLERAEALCAAAPPDRAEAVRSAVRRLMHPGRMGALFKAMAIAAPDLPPPPGFAAPPASERIPSRR